MSGNPGNGGRRRRLNIALLVLGLVLVFNAAYLAAYATPDLFYVINALLHPFLGVLAAVLFVIYLKRHKEFLTSFSGGICVLGLAGAAGFGVFLFFAGMTSAHTLALYLHVGFAIGGLFFLLIRLRARARDGKHPSFTRSPWEIAAAGFVAALIFYGGTSFYHHYFPNPMYQVKNPLTAPTTMYNEGGGKNSLMFPSSAETSPKGTIPSQYFMNSKTCEQCHSDIYHQWFDSMHHFSSFNNQWYRKAIEYMQDTVGIKPSMWCAGCHDHALAFTDMMQKYPIRKIEFTPEGQAGLGCMSCHSIAHVDSTMGNGHIDAAISHVEASITYAEPPRLFHNEGHGKFRDISALVGQSFDRPKVARGAAYGDFDNDGDLDVLMTTNNGPAYLYRNDGGTNHSIRFSTRGVRSNRDGIGTNVHIWTPQGKRWLTVKSGSSYLSCSDTRVTFGLGLHRHIEKALLEWPSGEKQELGKLEAGRTYVVQEGKGIINDIPFQASA